MYDANGVRRERTNWRDQAISSRHRDWGFDCPAVDVDFLMLEYDRAMPAALIEYKAVGARQPDLNHATYSALRALANIAKIPFLVVFYQAGQWWFRVMPANSHAVRHFAYNETLSEREYVSRLYAIRNQALPSQLARQLKNELPHTNEAAS